MTLSMRAILVFVMGTLGGLSAAWAQAGDPSGGPAQGAPGATVEAAVEAGQPDPAAQPDRTDSGMRSPERLQQKPSGFWTSGRPAVGGAYRYRLLGIGTGVLLLTAAMMIWVVRRYPRRDVEARSDG
jgi:hypothetical protein